MYRHQAPSYGQPPPPPRQAPGAYGQQQQQQQQYPSYQQQQPPYPPQQPYPHYSQQQHPQQQQYGGYPRHHQQQQPHAPPYPQYASQSQQPQQHPPAAAAAAPARGFSRPAIPPAPSAYASQAARWKKGFATQPASAQSSQQHLEAPLINELCTSAGSSYPPREVLQRLLRHLPSLDIDYLCELLDDKLEHSLWQVQGKALSALDALFKTSDGDAFKVYYSRKIYILEALCRSKKDLLRARAEKIYNIVRAFQPPEQPPACAAEDHPQPVPSSQQEQQRQEYVTPTPMTLLPPSPIRSSSAPQPQPLAPSPTLMAMDSPVVGPGEGPAVSAFGFLNATGAATPAETPAPVPVAAAVPPSSSGSAFAFLSTPVAFDATSTSPPPPRVVATHDVFSSLPAPTPVIGGYAVAQEPTPATANDEEKNAEEKVHDPIHDAFEGLHLDDDDDQEADGGTKDDGGEGDDVLRGFTTSNAGTMAMRLNPNDPVREVLFEIDVPAGPMGLMLDRSVPDMAIVQGFLPLPTGGRGYLELHPVLCPGCAIVSINGINVEDKGLEEVGAILGSLVGAYKVLKFKKLMRGGRIANPADPDVVYVPPPPEEKPKDEAGTSEDGQEGEDDETDSATASSPDTFTPRLNAFRAQLDDIERQVDELVQRDRANLPVVDMKNQLAQLHGHVEKVQTQGIDAVILGPNPPANADEIKQLRSSLVQRAEAIAKRIHKIVTHGTAPSPVIVGSAGELAAVGSPAISAFNFVGGGNNGLGMGGAPPALSLSSEPTSAASGFSFMQQSSLSPVTSPTGGAVSGFGFLQAPGSTSMPPSVAAANVSVPEAPVFAGLSIRAAPQPQPLAVNQRAAPPAVVVEDEQPSAFGFLSSSSATPSPITSTSPTAFGFLQRASTSSTASSSSVQQQPPPPPPPPPSGGSAFSFISS